MAERRRAAPRHARRRPGGLLTVLLGVLVLAGAGVALYFGRPAGPAPAGSGLPGAAGGGSSAAGAPGGEGPGGAGAAGDAGSGAPLGAQGGAGEYRAAWMTYLEYQQMDLSGEEAFRSGVAAAFDEMAALGVKTVIAHVRPFSDALYKSDYFPWSHLITGVQGQDPGYDPLAVLVEEAHARGLRLEAMVNPYRVNAVNGPKELAAENPASRFARDPARADWVLTQGGGLYYNPAIPEVRQLIVDGVRELCARYEIDGVQFDDYFYPEGAQDAFDQAAYDRLGGGQPRADWRRGNVNALVRAVYAAVKEENPALTFGISPQGNNDNNYNTQYSDLALWMREEGYVDYVMPQIYWGFDYRTSGGSDRFAFANCLAEWAAMPRREGVALYVGLAAYRVGYGDGGSNPQEEWYTGGNLARQVEALRGAGAGGYALYSYRWLWGQDAAPEAGAERAALTEANRQAA